MDSTLRRSQRDCSLAFKLSMVDQVERGELTYKKAQERYGIQGRVRGGRVARLARLLKPVAECLSVHRGIRE